MSFIPINPLSIPEINSTPSTPLGTRGLFAKADGWYEIDDQGNVKKLDGKSAYEIALEQGFEGTEEEWLESLKGKDGTNGDSYILTEADKTEISDSISAEIEAELNAALQEIITLQEELLIPDGNEVAY